MKQKITLCAGLIAALAVSGHALAQPAPPPAYPGTVYPNAGLPPHEIAAMVRSTGLEPLGSPVRQGPIYAMRAVDPAGGLRIFGGQPASLATQVPAIGIGTYQTALGLFAAPAVRTWKGGSVRSSRR